MDPQARVNLQGRLLKTTTSGDPEPGPPKPQTRYKSQGSQDTQEVLRQLVTSRTHGLICVPAKDSASSPEFSL